MKKINLNILITGGYGSNLGDDAMLLALLLFLKENQKDKTIGVLCYNKKYIPKICKDIFKDVRYIDRSDSYEISCDTLIYGGGNQHFSIGSSGKNDNNFRNLRRRVKFLIKNKSQLFFSLLKKINKNELIYRKKVFLGIGLGPFEKTPNLDYLDNSLVILRDKFSFNYYKNSILGADLCFNQYFLNDIKKHIAQNRDEEKKHPKKRICVVLRDWYHNNKVNDDVINMINDFIIKLNSYKDEFEINVISFCDVLDFEFKSQLNYYDNFFEYNSRSSNIYNVISLIDQNDIIITSRYHGMVFGSILNIPTIGINIDQKLKNFENEEKVDAITTVDISNDSTELLSKVTILLSLNIKELEQQFEIRNGKMIERNSKMMKQLNKFF